MASQQHMYASEPQRNFFSASLHVHSQNKIVRHSSNGLIQTALQLHHLGGYSKRAVKSDSHSFRVACNKSAVSQFKSGAQRITKVIDNIQQHTNSYNEH